MLKSEVPAARLLAAEAYQGSGAGEWLDRVRELARERDELTRVKAAELLACCDAPAARSILDQALSSPNQLLRGEAARVLEARHLMDAVLVRRLLGETFPMLRIYGAGAALRLDANPKHP
jgi:HEAT repeat protein